ncbi:hypothetical protein AVEN_133522-1 [Araneus ventricosus]|uniref:Uncharacterized protein n=1 Tax=Araneus ventricosus TaxID=182803 RepID=A0A4Y2P0K5_ARAVE|nr:hypothetical protein AVEN_133522-1 [Araneus ventricosus]
MRQLAPNDDSGIASGASQNTPDDNPDESVAEKYLRLFRVIQDGEPTPEAFVYFEELVQLFCADIKDSLSNNSAPPRTVIYNGEDQIPTAEDAQAIQKLYKRNKKRAIREILKSLGDRCMIDVQTIYNFFSTAWGPALSDPTYYSEAEDGRVEVIDRPFTVKEVALKLKKADNTSPGPDRIKYFHWRQIDPTAKTLSTIFNLCHLQKNS